MDIMRKYRKVQCSLMVAGQGTILFGVWSLIKILMYLTVDSQYFYGFIDGGDLIRESFVFKVLLIAFLFIFFTIDLLLRLKMGGSAIAVAKGQQRKNSYLVLTIVYLIVTVISDVINLITVREERITELISENVLELASCIVLLLIVVNSIQLKKYRAELGIEGGV